jgi:glycogen debranching enzyme
VVSLSGTISAVRRSFTEPSSRPRNGAPHLEPLVEECYRKAIALLLDNSSPHGILACRKSPKAERRNYRSVFGRDASICALGMVRSGDERLIGTARAGLETLARFQANNGQIPNYVRPTDREANFWHFGCIDSTLWWLIALRDYDRFSGDKSLLPSLRGRAGKAVSWLLCQEQPSRGLLVQNEASDWADIMPRSGHVLYTNALWYRVKELYRLSDAERTRQEFNRTFFPFSPNGRGKRNGAGADRFYTIDKIRKEVRPTPYYLSYVSYLSWGGDVDLYGNVLALLFRLPGSGLRRTILAFLQGARRNGSGTIPVILNPIRKGTKHWRGYMDRHNLNAPHQYHNGGVWPYVGCFWAILLAQDGQTAPALGELRNIAALNRVNDWQFNEWFHGKTGRPMGMAGQSWNAAMYLLAYHTLRYGATV